MEVENQPIDKDNNKKSLLHQAIANDRAALDNIFSQFLESDEEIEFAEYLGTMGMLIPTYSFGCLTNKRIISLYLGPFDFLEYKDSFLEEIKGVEIKQVDILNLILAALVFLILTFGLGLIFLGRFVKAYYRINKVGISFNCSKDSEVYIFGDKRKINRLNFLWRVTVKAKEMRTEILRNSSYE